jgi:Flp pilus assembly protein TadG
MRAVRSTRRSGQRGQSMVEFAIMVALLLSISVTAIDMVPAIAARGRFLDIVASATERSARFLPPAGGTAATDREALCASILAMVRTEMPASGMPVAGSGTGCAAGATGFDISPDAATANPVVWVSALDGLGNVSGATRLLPATSPITGATSGPVPVRVCIAYIWESKAGLLFVATRAPGQISVAAKSLFTFRMCGQDVINPYRTR